MKPQTRKFELIVITSPAEFPGETELINFFFDNGMDAVYCRKESYPDRYVENLLTGLKQPDHSKIILPLSMVNGSLRNTYMPIVHIKEQERKIVNPALLAGKEVFSTAIHDLSDLPIVASRFRYIFFSPVFESISKKNYKPRYTLEEMKQSITDHRMDADKLIALGGIDEQNISIAQEMGFAGAALLGSIWSDKDPKEKFLRIRSKIQ
jgi:thiamine-phosphate pyrophosphorylase